MVKVLPSIFFLLFSYFFSQPCFSILSLLADKFFPTIMPLLVDALNQEIESNRESESKQMAASTIAVQL